MKALHAKQFGTDVNVKQTVTSWLETCNTHFFHTGIPALTPWWQRSYIRSVYHLSYTCPVHADIKASLIVLTIFSATPLYSKMSFHASDKTRNTQRYLIIHWVLLPDSTANHSCYVMLKYNNITRFEVLTAMLQHSLLQVHFISDVEGGKFLW